MLIAQITDLHVGFDRGNPDEYNMERLRAVIRRLIDAPNALDGLALTGDLTEFGDAESYERLAELVGICPFPVWPMVGNHDRRRPLLAAFPDTPSHDGFVQYAIDLGSVRLILLDTLETGRHGGAFCERRAEWLEAELAAHPGRPTIIAMHHPPFASGIRWLDASEQAPWIARFAAAIAGRDQVRAIVCGHLHRNIQTVWNGASMTVCAATAPLVSLDLTPIDPDVPDHRAMITDEAPCYALHRWDGERFVSHVEAVQDRKVLARFDAAFQDVVQLIDEERKELR